MAVYKGNVNSGYLARWSKRLEEEDKKRQQEQAIKVQQENARKEEENKQKNVVQKAGEWLGEKAVDVGKGIVGTAQRVGGTVAQAGVGVVGAGATAAALLSGDKEGAQRINDKTVKTIHDIGNSKAIDDGRGSFISNDTLEGKSNPAKFAAEFTKAGADTAAFVQPELKGVGLTKAIASETGINAATTGAASAAEQYATTGKIDAGKVAEDAVTGGVTAGAVRAATGAVKRLRNSPEKAAEPSKTPSTDAVDTLAADEVKFRQDKADKQAFLNNGLPNDVEGAQKALDEAKAGNLPEAAYKPAQPVSSLNEIVDRPDIPQEIKSAAQEVVDDRFMVQQQLESLMSPLTRNEELTRMDQQYQNAVEQISQLPPQRAQIEQQALDQEYQDRVAEIDMLAEKDRPEVEKYQSILDKLDEREQNIVMDTRTMMKSAPDQFKDVDQAEADAIVSQLSDNLEQAKRFNEPTRIVESVSDSADPVTAYDRTPEAPEAFKKEITDQIASIPESDVKSRFKNITGVTLAAMRTMSPSQVLEKWGLRGEGLDLHTNILEAESALNKANKTDSEILTSISKLIPNNKQAQQQIIDYLQGNRKTLSSIDDQEAANMIRSWLDEKRAGLEQMGYKTLDDYFPHVFDKNNPDVQRLFKGKTTADLNFNNLKSRIAGSEDYSRDIMNVLTTYANSYNRKAILEPALKPLEDVKTQVELSNAEANWLDEYITQLKGFKQSNLADSYNQVMDNVYDKIGLGSHVGENHLAKHLGTQRMFSALATMGGNVATAVRQGTQMVNTMADIGPRYSTIGTIDGTRMLATKEGRDELARMGIIDSGVSQNYYDAITRSGVRGRATKARDVLTKTLMIGIRGTDIALRAQAYAGAKALAASKGLTGKEAERFAARKVVDTQFITSAADMPVAFNSPVVRSLTQLATFSGKQAGFLKRMGMKMVKDKEGNFHLDVKQAGSVLSAIVAATAMTEALKPVIGMRETEWVPFYDQIAPVIGAVTGQDVQGGDSLYRSPLVQLLAGDGKSKIGLVQALQGQDVNGDQEKSLGEGLQKFIEDQWSSLVPAGAQIKKTAEGSETTSTGVSRNSNGSIRFLQDMDIDSQVKATLFGQYATEAGRNWIQQGFPTLSDKQTQSVESQPDRQSQLQYAHYYAATKNAGGRQKAYDEVKQAAKDGNINKAQRIADEYNQKLNDALSDYWKQHNDMPQELQDDMSSRMINVNKVIDKVE